MKTAPTLPRTISPVLVRHRSFVWKASFGLLAASAINVSLFAIGRGALDASFLMDAAYGTSAHQVTAFDVAYKTLVPLAIGVTVIVMLARQWSGLLRQGAVAGGALAVLSGVLAAMRAHDTSTAVLIASMHALAGATFWLVLRQFETHRAR